MVQSPEREVGLFGLGERFNKLRNDWDNRFTLVGSYGVTLWGLDWIFRAQLA